MSRHAWLLVPILLSLIAGCAVPYARRDENPPRVRCLYESPTTSKESRDRPLLFFLCIEAP